MMDHAIQLGYDTAGNATTCSFWTDNKLVPQPLNGQLKEYLEELALYNRLLDNFEPVPDLRLHLDERGICESVELHAKGLPGIFPSGQLSLGSAGYMEPLLPPLRHPNFCFSKNTLMDLRYMVHDFGDACRKLKRHSRIVLVDMGASLAFHGGGTQPAVYLIELFRKFGLPFDHIYAFEVTPTKPETVFQKLPPNLFPSYHWINVGVSADPESTLNPLHMTVNHFAEDDLIIVKLDIDDTAALEVPLAHQLLHDTRLHSLVDHFYFEHHVRNADLAPYWARSMKGSFKESVDLFRGLRQAGVPAHSWV